jgi:hypothetical protein
MKTKILLTAIATMVLAYTALASVPGEFSGERGNGYGNQQIVVNNYYYESGYEYASRINRFHNSYVAFDFYSPLYTETFWYHYTPYTWGVSIYDDWYYYGGGVSRYNWTSGFGGSYWWGYDPWWNYDPWMGYGWNSWYAPGMSYGVNYYLGRPYYHYPMAWNSWSYSNWNSYGPYDRYDNHNYHHGPDDWDNNNGHNNNNNTGYNPSKPYDTGHRQGYPVSTRRSTGSQSTTPGTSTGTAPRTTTGSGTHTSTGTGTRTSTSTGTGTSTGTTRRTSGGTTTSTSTGTTTRTPTGTAPGTTTGTAPATTTGTAAPVSETSSRRSTTVVEKPASVVRVTEPTQPRQQTQTIVRSNKQVRETTMRQSSTVSSSTPAQSTVEKSSQQGVVEAAEGTSPSGNEPEKTGSSTKSRR